MLPSRFAPFSPRLMIGPALLALAACSGGGGGGASAPVAAADAYVFSGTSQLRVYAPGVLSNDSGASPNAVLVGSPAHAAAFTFNANGSFTYTNDGINNSDIFSYKITDANGTSNVTTVSLALNQAPTPVNACLPTPAGLQLNGTLTATDEPSSKPDTFSLVTDPIGPLKGQVLDLPNNTGTFRYIPNNPNFVGMDKFKFQVTDQFGATSTGIATVLINGAVRIMPLGDSITEGVWYADPGTTCQTTTFAPDSPWLGNCPASGVRVSYRQKLYNDLEALYPNLQALNSNYGVNMVGSIRNGVDAGLAQPFHEGHAGYSTAQINSGISTWLTSNPPDIILLHIGTNSFTTSATDVNTLLNSISSWAQGYYGVLPSGEYPVTVYVARIIQSVDGTLGGSPGAVTTFNDNVAAIATDRTDVKVYMVDQQTGAGLNYALDTSPTCLAGGACSGDMGNNLHPNPSGYVKMANKWRTDLQTSGVLPTCP